MKEIAKEIFDFLLERQDQKGNLYPSQISIVFKTKEKICVRLGGAHMGFLEAFIIFVKEKDLFLSVEPEDDNSIFLVVRPPRYTKMTDKEREEAIAIEEGEVVSDLSSLFDKHDND